MTEPALLAELRARDVHVWADGDQLQCDAPAGVLTPELRDQLQQRKTEILEFLRGPVQLSSFQQQLWFLDQVEPGGAAYIFAHALELRGTLDALALERALGALVCRHDSLRTVFVNIEGRPLQVVSEPGPWTLPVEDLSGQAGKDQRLAQRLREEASRSFDLARGPLFRARLYRVAADTQVLLLTMHHIIADGWSIGILIRELGELYAGFWRGEEVSLPTLRLQYRDFALWQQSWLLGEALGAQLSHWQLRLAGAPQVLELPADRLRPPVESHRGAIYSFTLPVELTDALRGFALRQGATLFMTLLSGFTLLLSRYSGQEDLLVGTPVANRSAEFEDLVGCFLNTLVLRADASGKPSAREYLARIREVCLDTYAHQDLPFDRLVEELRPARDMSRNPVFQVMFVLQNTLQRAVELPGLTLRPLELDGGTAKVDLTLEVQETSEGLRATFNYATDLFEEATIARMATHWRLLLDGMIATPERGVWDLPLLTEPERQQALSGCNPAASYPRGACLHERFERQAERTPEAVALVYEGQHLTYAELNRRANRLAHRLRELGVAPDQLVGLRIERGIEMVIGIVGILKSGGAYLPLDPTYPKERVAFMLEDSHVSVIVTQESLAADLDGIAATRILLDKPLPGAVTNPAPVATADNLAYVIYTSGSTGKPKGVLITHYNVTRLFEATDDWYHFDKDDVWTLFHSYAFDFSVWELWGALLYGGRLVVVAYWVSRSPEAFRELLMSERVTVLNQTPSAFRQLIQIELSKPKAELALRYVIFGGEALELQGLRPWFERYGDERPVLVNMYGITETTVHVTYRPVRRVDLDSGHGSVIGAPIPDLQVYILDPTGQPTPIGVPGEIYVGGEGVARGYLNRAELTVERFLPDSFAPANGARLYRTGDLARRLANGDIEYLGRIDHQVKIRGFRVELGEIEATLAEHPDVRQAAVHLWTVKPGDVRLVACCVPAKPGVLAPISLRKHLRARLPEYMVPHYLLPMDEIPLTPTGKVDRRRLPTPVLAESRIGQDQHEAPSDPVEATIAEIWTELIHPARAIGRNDRFFEMGGHSLLGLQAMRQMEHKLGVKLDLRVLFQENLAEIATRCRSERIAQGGNGDSAASPAALSAHAGNLRSETPE